MIDRCSNPRSGNWRRYGARGIDVSDEWRGSFVAFRDWALSNGYGESLSIDRIDNDGNYTPANCRWVTPQAQANNRTQGGPGRHGRAVTAWGDTRWLYQWLTDPRCTVSQNMLKKRLNRGWSAERAMTEPMATSADAGKRGAAARWG
jgi:hypothetical protein